MRRLWEIEFTYLFLADANLERCKGCFGCISNGEDRCPFRDDLVKVEGQIEPWSIQSGCPTRPDPPPPPSPWKGTPSRRRPP